MQTIEEYFKNATTSQKAEYERIRKIVKEIVPEAEESISYGIPTFKYKTRPLIYFGAYPNHMSLYGGIDFVREKLGDFKLSKGTVQFTEDKPVPEAIIKEMVTKRLAQISK